MSNHITCVDTKQENMQLRCTRLNIFLWNRYICILAEQRCVLAKASHIYSLPNTDTISSGETKRRGAVKEGRRGGGKEERSEEETAERWKELRSGGYKKARKEYRWGHPQGDLDGEGG